MDLLRWRVGDATVLRIAELDAAAKRCAESDTLLIGAHFAGPVAGRIRRNGSGFRLLPVAD
jgi:hypothetical protein